MIKSSHLKNNKIALDGHLYNVNRQIDDKFYWICDLYKSNHCNGRLITQVQQDGDHKILKKSFHTHGPSPHRALVAECKSNIRHAAIEDVNSAPSRIVDCVNTSPLVLNNQLANFMGTTSSLRKIVKRARNNHSAIKYPPNPANLDFVYDLDFQDLNLNGEQLLLYDCLSADKTKRVTIFTTDTLFVRFCAAELMVSDGTFKTCPEPYKQLFIIHGNIPGYDDYFTQPMIWVLMSGKDQNLYETVFNNLRQTAIDMGLVMNLKYSLNDFEIAIRNAIQLVFPAIDNRACFFHLRQLTIKRLKKLKLFAKYQKDPSLALEINQVMALAFFPPNEIEELFEILHQTVSEEAKIFYDWFKPLYIRKSNRLDATHPPTFWSIYDFVLLGLPKTQNGAEQSHHSLFLACGKVQHLPLYKFLSVLKSQMIKSEQNITKILNGLIEKRRTKFYEQKENIIHHILTTKDDPNKHLINSLRAVASSLTSFIHLLVN